MRRPYYIGHSLNGRVLLGHNLVRDSESSGCVTAYCFDGSSDKSACPDSDPIQCACSNTQERLRIESCILNTAQCSTSDYENFVQAMNDCSDQPNSGPPDAPPTSTQDVPKTTQRFVPGPTPIQSNPSLTTATPREGSTNKPVAPSSTRTATGDHGPGTADTLTTSSSTHSYPAPSALAQSQSLNIGYPLESPSHVWPVSGTSYGTPSAVSVTDTFPSSGSTSESSAIPSPTPSAASTRGSSPKVLTAIVALLGVGFATFLGASLLYLRRRRHREAKRAVKYANSQRDGERRSPQPAQQHESDGTPEEENLDAVSLLNWTSTFSSSRSSSIRAGPLDVPPSRGYRTLHSGYYGTPPPMSMVSALDPPALGWTLSDTPLLLVSQHRASYLSGLSNPSADDGSQRESHIFANATCGGSADILGPAMERGAAEVAAPHAFPDVNAGGMEKTETNALAHNWVTVLDDAPPARPGPEATPVSSSLPGMPSSVSSASSSRSTGAPRKPRFMTVLMEVEHSDAEEEDEPPPYQASRKDVGIVYSRSLDV